MHLLTLRSLSLKSFLKLSLLLWCGVGLMFGAAGFVGALLGGDTLTSLELSGVDRLVFKGIKAGVALLLLGPLFGALLGVFFGLVGFLPFALTLRLSGGVRLRGDVERHD